MLYVRRRERDAARKPGLRKFFLPTGLLHYCAVRFGACWLGPEDHCGRSGHSCGRIGSGAAGSKNHG